MPSEQAAALADIYSVLNHRPTQGGTAGIAEMAAMLKACIERWAPIGSSYRRMADAVDALQIRSSDADVRLRGVLMTMERDYRAGLSGTVEERVHAAVLDDLIGQGDRLLDHGHRWAAAVIMGAALEQHLRQLAGRLDVAFELPDARGVLHAKQAHRLNDELRGAPAYGHQDWTRIQGWLTARDRAIESRDTPELPSEDDLRSMATGVRDFIRRHPA